MPRDASDAVEYVNAAIQLFREVDLNLDGQMEWREFVDYI
jgi:hypothetical protein